MEAATPFTVDELAGLQHAGAVRGLGQLAADIWEPDEELDEFLADLRASRHLHGVSRIGVLDGISDQRSHRLERREQIRQRPGDRQVLELHIYVSGSCEIAADVADPNSFVAGLRRRSMP